MSAAAKSKPISSHRVSSNSPASSVATTDRAEHVAGGKPDKKHYEAEQMRLKAEIDVLQAKLVIYFST